MSKHLGDYDTSTVIYGKFSTFRPSTGASYTLGGSPALSVYKDNSTTQSTTGVTLTVDFDGVTGYNHYAIDTSADGTFYSAGSNFDIVITTGTVDSVSVVGAVVGSFSIRKTSSLKPTTSGRTLDVSAGGEAGIDWANVGTPSSTVSLSGTTVATVTTTTTATNLTNERGKYMHGAVWIGPTANTNTASYTDGIMTNPVSTIAAAKTIADNLGLKRFWVQTGVTVTLAADYAGYVFTGIGGWTLTTSGSRSVSGSIIDSAYISGGTYTGASAPYFMNCEFTGAATIPGCNAHHCEFSSGTITLGAGNYDFIDCASVVAGTSAPVFDCNSPGTAQNISFRRWSGGITLNNINSNTTVSIDVVSGGTVTLNGADGNVQVRGMCAGITDNRTGTPTLGQNGAINITKINTECDTALTDYGPLKPTVAGRTLDVSAGGEAGVDWANVGTPGSTVALSGTTVATTSAVTGLTAADVGAIKTQTDKFVFTVANQVDANIQSINDTTIVGNGVSPKFGV